MKQPLLISAILLVGACAQLPQTPPPGVPAQVTAPEIRAGDGWIYSGHDGYTHLPLGTFEYRVRSAQGDTITVEARHEGRSSTQVYTRDWNWRERPMTNMQNFRYDPPYAALPFPLQAGKTWQVHVNATDPATGNVYRVRIDGKVLGWERVKVPAGEFDTLMISRRVYTGNEDSFRSQEYISEFDWFAPGVGQVVKHAGSSGYRDKRIGCDFGDCGWIWNAWSVLELTSHQRGGEPRPR